MLLTCLYLFDYKHTTHTTKIARKKRDLFIFLVLLMRKARVNCMHKVFAQIRRKIRSILTS